MSFRLIDTSALAGTRQLIDRIADCKEEYIVLSDVPQAIIDDKELSEKMSRVDLLHSGLAYHRGEPFSNLQVCTSNWNYLNADPSQPAVSWKPSLHFAVFRKDMYDHMGGLDEEFESAENALIDFAYRVFLRGGVPWYDPVYYRKGGWPVRINYRDEGRFILKHIHRKAFSYYRFCMFFLRGRIIRSPRTTTSKTLATEFSFRLLSKTSRDILAYTALIPTIKRYDYIVKSIESLLKLSFPPAEIIVIDQSPSAKRREDLYKPFIESGRINVIFLDKAGQSSARNAGLNAASNEWILLFEDDAEAWPEMVNEHIRLLQNSTADASTGVVVGPGQDESIIPVSSRKHCLSDIFTTGNAFLSKQTALSVGGFDTAFDHGPGADDDFGKRLYLSGKRIVYNHKSIETHYKASTGGMREHGAWWRTKSTFWGPFPPATQLYAMTKYYRRSFRPFLILSSVLKARRRYSMAGYVALILLMPIKLWKSYRIVRKLRR